MFAVIKPRFYSDKVLPDIKKYVHSRWNITINKEEVQFESFSEEEKKNLFEDADKKLKEEESKEKKERKVSNSQGKTFKSK